MYTELEKFLIRNEQKMHEDLQDFVAIPSVSEDREKVKEALRFILDLAGGYGFKAESFLDEQVGVIEMGEGDETLGILAHVDVVPPGDLSQWTFDPYKAIDCEGRMYGRGTIDDKGMVIACLYAMRAVKSLGQPLKKKVQLILGTQEEVEWTDMNAYVKEYPLPDYGFTPDGEYPICNIEKGIVDQEMEFDFSSEDEPEGLHLVSINAGIANNVVPGSAEAVLSDGRVITAKGHECHSSTPEHGENAIFKLAEKLEALDLKENGLLRLVRDVTRDFSDWMGSGVGLKSESEQYMGEFVHRNTLSPTILQTKEGKTRLVIDLRFPYGEDAQRIIDTLDKLAAERGGRTVMTDALPAVFVSRERPFLKVFEDAYEDISGFVNEFTVAYGGSYAKAMPNIVSWGPLFPGEEDVCHMPNEYIDLKNMLISTKIFARSIGEIALSDESFK